MRETALVKLSIIGLLFALSLLFLAACGSTAAQPRATTPDIQATITAGVSIALANLPTPTATPAPTPDIGAMVARQVEAALETRPTPAPTPAPAPDFQLLFGFAVEAALAARQIPTPMPGPAPDIQSVIEAAVEAAMAVRAESQGADAPILMQGDMAANGGGHDAAAMEAAMAASERVGGLAVFNSVAQSTPASVRVELVTQWSTSSNGQFIGPIGIAVGPSGLVYMTDDLNHRVRVFSASGALMREWGTQGSGDGQFDIPFAIAVSPAGLVYVTELGNHRVQVFDINGEFVAKWGTKGTGDGQFLAPVGIALGPSGESYVTDALINRVQVFSVETGELLFKWGTKGIFSGQFDTPIGIAVAPSGRVYVTEQGNARVQVFTRAGKFLSKWGTPGSGSGQFSAPFGVAVGPSGSVYVTGAHVGDHSSTAHGRATHRVQVFSADGTFLTKWGTLGSEDGQFSSPFGIAVDPSGKIYVADHVNDRVQVFN